MRTLNSFRFFLSVLTAIWVLSTAADVQAQEQGEEKDKKRNEQMIEEEKRGNNESRRDDGTQTGAGSSASAHDKKIKYKPRGMTDEDLKEWTDGNPPGWSRGNKTGWGAAGAPPGQMNKHREQEMDRVYPPGSESWDARRKEDWNRNLDQSRARILARVRAKEGMSLEDEESAVMSIERAAQLGAPPEHVEATMDRAITRGMRGRDIEKVTRAMSYGADKNTDYNGLNQFIEKKMNEGETGDDLALSIYREIDEQHAAKPEQSVKKPWWKRLFGG